MYNATNMHLKSYINFLFVSSINANNCHIINFLLTSLARYLQINIGPRSFCTNLALRARSVRKRPRSAMVFGCEWFLVGKKESIGIFCFLRPNVYNATNMHLKSCINFLFVSSINANNCHIINFLLTSLARYLQRNIGPRSFCTNLALWARSVRKRPRSAISLYRPRVQLIRS
jgi:hypothetical protein